MAIPRQIAIPSSKLEKEVKKTKIEEHQFQKGYILPCPQTQTTVSQCIYYTTIQERYHLDIIDERIANKKRHKLSLS